MPLKLPSAVFVRLVQYTPSDHGDEFWLDKSKLEKTHTIEYLRYILRPTFGLQDTVQSLSAVKLNDQGKKQYPTSHNDLLVECNAVMILFGTFCIRGRSRQEFIHNKLKTVITTVLQTTGKQHPDTIYEFVFQRWGISQEDVDGCIVNLTKEGYVETDKGYLRYTS